MLTYPPYCDIAQVTVQSSEKGLAEDTAKEVFKVITEKVKTDYSDVKLKILGPSAAAMPKVNGKYRYRLIIKAKNSARFRKLLRSAVLIKTERDTSISVDINPETVI